MAIRHSLVLLATALALGCSDAAPPHAGPVTRGIIRLATAGAHSAPAVSRDRGPTASLALWTQQARSGTLLLREETDGELVPGPVLDTRVEIQVTGLLARAVVSQRFANPSTTWAEGIYVFPLPDDAAVDHMRIVTESQVIEGRVEERQQARRRYERARRAGRQAGLVEQERPNVFTTSVANIRPGSSVSVEIEYQQTVQLDQGEFSLRFPLVVGPRYLPGRPRSEGFGGAGAGADTDPVAGASRISPPVWRPETGLHNPVELAVDLAPGFEIGRIVSPYHDVRVDEQPGGHVVTLAHGPIPANRDFVLRWTPAPEREPGAALFVESRDDGEYALLMLTPPLQPSEASEPPPREIVYVVDTSGSMAGASLSQAQLALALALERLRPDDRFNVIEFNSVTRALFRESQPAGRWNVERALDFVRGLRSEGGTEILPALHRALADASPGADTLRQVVFLTDGSVGNEAELFEAIQAELGRSRLFTVGIGSAPNTHFMRKAAWFGRGSFTHIGSPDDVADAMTALFRKLESVVLADLDLELPSGVFAEPYPYPLSDLYAGEPLVVALKLDAPLDWIGVRGRTGDDPWQLTLDRSDAVARTGVHVLWARRKIAALMDARLGLREEALLLQLREDTVRVALAHHLVSAYTSLVAVDVTPERPAHENLASYALATELPAGWDADAVFGLATTATGADGKVLLGLLGLVTGGTAWLRRVRS